VPVDLAALPLDDAPPTRCWRAATRRGFPVRRPGHAGLPARHEPDRFEDLIAAVSLYRPGPMENIPAYCSRKHGEEWLSPHPSIHAILAETYGIMVYQEQVMQIAQVMAGYSLGSADLLRRAMGKKDRVEMARQRAIFCEGAEKNGVPRPRPARSST
jgi:DNA polymerase-3 subunit alpha